jgi:hypothetical protein
MNPRQDLSRSGRVLPLNDPFVIDPDLPETAVALKRIGAYRGVVRVDGPTHEGAQVVLEGEPPPHSEAKAPGRVFSMLDGSCQQGLADESSAASEPGLLAPDVALVHLDGGP